MTETITIDGREIGIGCRPYIVAELSANHNGDIDRAMLIIDKVKEAGADALKLQTYSADTITIKSDRPEFQIRGGLWDGRSLHDLYQWAQMPWEWHELLFQKARDLGLTVFSSPFDFTAVDLLETLDAPAYKIASFEAIDLPLIRYVASTGKPMIISTGMADAQEIEEAIEAASDAGCEDLALLHCVSGYPAPAEEYNLATISDMISRFDVPIGLSDHTIDNTTAIASVALGACIIEKHVTLDRAGGGPDDSFSLEPHELAQLCRNSKTAWAARGEVSYRCKNSEQGNIGFRRSLYAVENIRAGERFTETNIRSIRPGGGLKPKFYWRVVASKASQDIARGTPLDWDLIESGPDP